MTMFEYSDPSGTNLLSRFRAISEWRTLVEGHYRDAAKEPGSAFTWIDALLNIEAACGVGNDSKFVVTKSTVCDRCLSWS